MRIKIRLTESKNNELLNEIQILDKIGKELKTSVRFITTFGTGVGAFYPAISRMLENSSVSLNKEEVILLIVTSISVLIHSDEAEKLKQKVEEQGLVKTYNEIHKFIKEYHKFINLLKNKSNSISITISDLLGYTALLVPSMRIISKVIQEQNLGITDVKQLFAGLLVSSSAYGIKSLLDKNKIQESFDDEFDTSDVDTIPVTQVEEIFKYFHLSAKKLNGNQPFTFTKRVPKYPFENDGRVIEDDFTPRISLATRIKDATDALSGTSTDFYYVYAADVESRVGDDVKAIPLDLKFQKCKQNLDTEDNKYGPTYDFKKFIRQYSDNPKLNKIVDKMKKNMSSGWGEVDYLNPEKLVYSPAQLPSELKKKWYACVPDALETNEYWGLEDTRMYLLGTYEVGDDVIVLTPEARELLNSIENE